MGGGEPIESGPAFPGDLRRIRFQALRRGFVDWKLQERTSIGLVYLARSIADERVKTLLVVRHDVAASGLLAERLAREALAATHLDHPNLARVEDLYLVGKTLLIVLESPAGRSCAEVLKEGRRLDAKDAAVAVLQAARGIRHAHERGMYHRCLTPSSLVVQPDGQIRVVGLGMVGSIEHLADLTRREEPLERPSGSTTRPPASVATSESLEGVPLTPQPENPWVKFSEQDRRADVVALGKVLRALVRGRHETDASGANASRSRVPGALETIIGRMTGDHSEESWRDLGPAIAELQRFLNLDPSEPLALPSEVSEPIRHSAELFANPPSARVRNLVQLGFVGFLALVAVLSLLAGRFALTIGVGLFGLVTWFGARSFGEARRSEQPIWSRLRAWLVDALGEDPLLGLACLGLLMLGVWAVGLIAPVLTLGVASILLVVAYRLTVGARFETERDAIASATWKQVKELRLTGHDEASLRRFVWAQGGPKREELFEAVFGFHGLRDVVSRSHQVESPWITRQLAGWRMTLARRLDSSRRLRATQRRWSMFRELAERRACSRGVYLLTARRRSRRIADAIFAVDEELGTLAVSDGEHAAIDIPAAYRAAVFHSESILADHEVGLSSDGTSGWLTSGLDLLLGSRPRFLLGALLTAGCLVWVHQNNLLPRDAIDGLAGRVTQVRDLDSARELAEEAGRLRVEVPEQVTPLHLPPLPRTVAERIGTPGAGVAGLILLLSAPLRGWSLGLPLGLAAILAIFGPDLGIPAIAGFGAEATSILGAIAVAFGTVIWNWRR